ncbi:UNKNOWN [Stylonychia lemnae]|uniref:EGF-like domain-containing protein n=1 Tax=Stylonychia lemnae TaxID=5949 RepID=A0A078B4P0_STYLE|nr:UNKNOWN [Stylonychia lemnae]|eukprot:CDW89500.1 UNKNOWN [Stylonychia lemnae]
MSISIPIQILVKGVERIANPAIQTMAVRYVQEKISKKGGSIQFKLIVNIVRLKMNSKFANTDYECKTCSKDDITKCTECSYPVNQKSLLIGDAQNPCTSQSEYCLDALSQNSCQLCIYGYGLFIDSIGNKKCLQCQSEQANSEDIFDTIPINCNFSFDVSTGMPKQGQITACLNGYFDPLKNKCISNCGVGRYGQVTFNQRGMIDSSVCNECDNNCFECATQHECISCKKGFYLSTGSNQKTTGICILKSGTSELVLYVDSVIGMKTTDQITGLNLDDPFYSIQSAIIKAYEYGSEYENAIVNIMLIPGKVHSMLRYDEKIILPQKYDQNSQSTKIIIDTLDGTQVKVLYKLRDKYTFLVGGGLELRNIVFDATDSILDPRFTSLDTSLLNSNDYTCLKDPFNNCCQISKDLSSGKYTTSGPEFCQFQIQPDDQCHLPIGGSLIQFDISNQTTLASPQFLNIENVRFENFIYDFNTIIEINDLGGHISMINTSFTNINSCGSVIRNKRFDQVSSYLEPVFLSRSLLNSFEILKSKLPSTDIFQDICGKSMNIPCFSLNISGGIVEDFGRMINFSQDPQWVNPLLKMKNLGQFLDLDNFQGPVLIQNVNFTNNLAVNLDQFNAKMDIIWLKNHSLMKLHKSSQSEYCLDALSQNSCQLCIYGYGLFIDSIGNQKCLQCQSEQPNTEDLFDTIPINCNFSLDVSTGMAKQGQITACLNGYFDPLKNKCISNCGAGRYGQVTFNQRGMIDSSVCNECDNNCFECATQHECTSCKKGFYLSTGSNQKTTGICILKSGTSELVLYVDSVIGMKTTDQITGLNLDDPFYSIQSAIIKAYEYGSEYENAIVNIILIPDGTQVKVLYKLRDKYTFLVGGGLELRNIVFDATDSILDPRFTSLDTSLLNSNDYTCLKDPFNNCCQISKDLSSGKYTTSGPEFCQFQIQPDDQCHLPIGGSLIQFDISNQTTLASPQFLNIELRTLVE